MPLQLATAPHLDAFLSMHIAVYAAASLCVGCYFHRRYLLISLCHVCFDIATQLIVKQGAHIACLVCRPFGEYVMCTSSKSVRFEEPEAVLQLLVLTMQASAAPFHTGADVLREHSMKRYMAAVQHIDLASPAWKQASAFFPDARNVIEFGYVKLLQVCTQLHTMYTRCESRNKSNTTGTLNLS